MIDSFNGKYRFLSNFYPALVRWDGWLYPTVEHAYQAAKLPPDQRVRFRDPGMKPGEAKRLGKGKGGDTWKDTSLDMMLVLLRQKFREPKLAELLLETGTQNLVEGNNWHDTFYGRCNGDCTRGPHAPIGDNHLGKLLEQVRHELYAET